MHNALSRARAHRHRRSKALADLVTDRGSIPSEHDPGYELAVGSSSRRRLERPRNDPCLYDELAGAWWDRRGVFAMLHWLALARASCIPDAASCDALLVDLGCGGGLLTPHVIKKGYRCVGVDLSSPALQLTREHGSVPLRADLLQVPLASGCADVVVAGEVLEHVAPFTTVIDEACRLLRPGGLLVLDTIANTLLARLIVVELAERIPGGAPPGIHDPKLFVDRALLVARAEKHGVSLTLRGLRPNFKEMAHYLRQRRDEVSMVVSRSSAVLFQAIGTKTP